MTEPVAPPLSKLPEKQLDNNDVVNVQAVVPPDEAPLPPELKTINKVVTGTADAKERIQAADHINRITEETKDYHPNMQPQWGAVIVGVTITLVVDSVHFRSDNQVP